MSYFIRVHFNDNSYIDTKAVGKGEKSLIGYDYYTTTPQYKAFLEEVIKQSHKTMKDFSYAKIGYVKDNSSKDAIEFTLTNDNPYMKNIFKDIELEPVDMYGTNKYSSERRIISNTSPKYEEMKDYIFGLLKNDPKVLLDEILGYKDVNKDSFKNALYRYSKAFYDSNSNEDQRERTRLERAIKEELTDYVRYRGIAVARYRYDKKIEFKNFKEKLKELDKEYDEKNSIEHKIDNYKNDSIDDFIPETEEEYKLMAGGDIDNDIYKSR